MGYIPSQLCHGLDENVLPDKTYKNIKGQINFQNPLKVSMLGGILILFKVVAS